MQPTKLQLTGQHQLRRVEFISPTKLVTDISASYYKLIKSVEILKTLFRGAKTEQRCFNINISLKIFPTQFYLGTFWIRAPFSHFMNIFREVSYSLLPCWYVEYKIRKLNYDKFDIIVRVHQLSPVFFTSLSIHLYALKCDLFYHFCVDSILQRIFFYTCELYTYQLELKLNFLFGISANKPVCNETLPNRHGIKLLSNSI